MMQPSTLRSESWAHLRHYVQLAKPGIVMGNLVSTIGGFLLASRGSVSMTLMCATMLGVCLVIASGCVFNNYIDRDIDMKMQRTKKRVLVQGLVVPSAVLIYGTVLGLLGFGVLYLGVNTLAALLAIFGFAIYVGVYSLYMKRHSVHGTLIGSLSGAMPPVIGYCAVAGHIDLGAVLLLIMFSLWQMPHSYAIGILYRDDYAAAGVPVLPVARGTDAAKTQIIWYIPAFAVSALLLTFCGYVGYYYCVVIAALCAAWMYVAVTGRDHAETRPYARKLFLFSIIIVTALSIMMSVDYVR
jgi:protoheme IX farnesyltransferase